MTVWAITLSFLAYWSVSSLAFYLWFRLFIGMGHREPAFIDRLVGSVLLGLIWPAIAVFILWDIYVQKTGETNG